ncbi:aminopeptidase PepB [Idiomarina sp. UBA4520]|jgi:PepB aminopeptidase|uniref:aminopeptidase PepB n=1 Tax=Idiomarina sp. UBA4520 TaxID=1946647 RepID=UPI000AEEEC70|nr:MULTISPECIES: aminopeptidase PepB [unclassified Idiomarina]|tara:strand:- start:23504 stop:24802 length:1299 start_codon:yes stop_codon:yes gene_type:complete
MSSALAVYLTNEAPAAHWNPKSNVVFDGDAAKIILVDDESENLRRIQKAGRTLDNNGVIKVAVSGDGWDMERQWALYQGFTSTLSKNDVIWHADDAEAAKHLDAMRDATRFSRELTNLPAEDIYPESLAERVIEHFIGLAPDAISAEFIKGEALKDAGWMGIYTVGRASQHAPGMLVLDYNPTGDDNAPVDTALIGKGITYDSGGYSIKPSEGMLSMKCDMGGAATVTGALSLAIRRGLNKRVKLILCCAENMIDGRAYKLGDIIRYKNGLTVEVVNTDAEGRLVLADGLQAAGEFGAKNIIDAATLTGAAQMAVGNEYNALFSVDDSAAARALKNADKEHELLWRLPLAPWHSENCPSAFADTANSRPQKGGGAGGASNAAGFLLRFAPEQGKGWLHFDLAGAYQKSATAMWSTGATALGVRTIAATVQGD